MDDLISSERGENFHGTNNLANKLKTLNDCKDRSEIEGHNSE